jgi:proteasome accessory factor A
MCPDAASFVRWQEHVRRVAIACRRYLQRCGYDVRVHLATTNRAGVAWGWHLNMLLARVTFNRWREAKWRDLMLNWVPFLVTSPILLGTGKTGSENGRPAAAFQLSERADFVNPERIVDLETVLSKSLINSRDEALCDPARFARFHISGVFDCNLMPYATFLKFGTVQTLLALLEAGAPLPDLTLADPLGGLSVVSRDLTLRRPLRMADGTQRTALEVQESLAVAAAHCVQKGYVDERIVPRVRDILDAWLLTLQRLRRNGWGDPKLRRRLDWVAKLQAIRHARDRLGCEPDDARLQAVDLAYAELDGGWFERLEQHHQVDRLEDFLPGCEAEGPLWISQRDLARAELTDKFPYHVAAVDWDAVCLSVAGAGGARMYRIILDDPLDASAVRQAVAASRTAAELVRGLPPSVCRQIQCGVESALASVQSLSKKEPGDEPPTESDPEPLAATGLGAHDPQP